MFYLVAIAMTYVCPLRAVMVRALRVGINSTANVHAVTMVIVVSSTRALRPRVWMAHVQFVIRALHARAQMVMLVFTAMRRALKSFAKTAGNVAFLAEKLLARASLIGRDRFAK